MQSSINGSVFSQTLQFITSIKLEELEKQRLAFQAHARVLEELERSDKDLITKVELLLEAIRSWTGSGATATDDIIGGKLNIRDLELWLPQAKKDPCFSRDTLKSWISTLQSHIRHNLVRLECAKLFGNLSNEWLASGDSSTSVNSLSSELETNASSFSDFVDVGRKEKHEQLDRLTSIIFDETTIDSDRLVNYLGDLFSSDEAEKELKAFRSKIEKFGLDFRRKNISDGDVRDAIRGLLASGLMDERKRETLSEVLDNRTVVTEVASVLNMRMAGLDTWSWPSAGLVVEIRRHLNGKYRAFTDPEIIDAILLQHIGVAWQVKFKDCFKAVFRSKAWIRPKPATFSDRMTSIKDQLRVVNRLGIEDRRQELRERHFFHSGLTTSASETKSYDDLLDADESVDQYGPAATKRKLLQLMAAECCLNMTLRGTHAIIRSDLEWFGPSLPHISILTVLRFFGVPEEWCNFFKTFLRSPLRFKQDPEGEIRVRKRGTPISYALSMLFGEVVLFGMDFAVNQKATGLFLYRMHDDLWLWDSDATKCAVSWKEINIYARLVGLKFNQEKTGSVRVGSNPVSQQHVDLPAGDIRWGFLKFDSKQARFIIDQQDVNYHIVELRRQLEATKSVFGWVNAYNKYMAFFLRNLGGGRPAMCFGAVHLGDMLDTFARIQTELFPSTEGGPIGHLRSEIQKRIGVQDLPTGYFYLPVTRGGLELRNPMIEMFAAVKWEQTAQEKLEETMGRDEEIYVSVKEMWKEKNSWSPENFMSYEEYIGLRETWLPAWTSCYDWLLSEVKINDVSMTPVVKTFLQPCEWIAMNWYEKWIVSLYGEEMIQKFGGLDAVDPTLIPLGMVQLFKTSRMKLDE